MHAVLVGGLRRARGWLGSHALHIPSLSVGVRITTTVAVSVAGGAAAAMLTVWLRGPEEGLMAWLRGPEEGLMAATAPAMGLLALGTVAAVAALGLGVALLVAGSLTLGGPSARAVRTGAAAVALFTCCIGLVFMDGELGDVARPAGVLARLPLWAGIGVALVLFILPTRGACARWTSGMAGIPFLCLGLGGLAQGMMTGDSMRAAGVVGAGMLPLAFVGIAAGAALLFWLAVEGLRLSRDVGVALLGLRVSPAWLVLGLVCLKAGLLALLWSFSAAGRVPAALPVLDALTPPPTALLAASPFVAAALWLLTREERLGLVERHFLQATLGLSIIFLIVLSPIILLGAYTAGLVFARSVFRVLGFVLLIATAVWSRTRGERWRWWSRAGWLAGAVLLASCAPLLDRLEPVRGPAGTLSEAMARQVVVIDPEGFGASLLGALLTAAAIAVAVLLARPAFRPAGLFLLAILVWGLPTVMVPGAQISLFGAGDVTLPAVDPVAFDVVLGAAAVALVVAWQRRWQTAIRPAELVLLTVASTFIVYGSALKNLMSPSVAQTLVPFALILPALMQLTLDAGPLNVDGEHRDRRVLTTSGLICTSFGLVLALILLVGREMPIVNELVEFGSGVCLIPLAVVLAAVTSADLQTTEPAGAPPG